MNFESKRIEVPICILLPTVVVGEVGDRCERGVMVAWLFWHVTVTLDE